MTYIDLYLSENNSIGESFHSLEEIIEKEDRIVILGAPGSGKSSILQKFHQEHIDSELITVKRFLKLRIKPMEGKSILLLDGLDEYRFSNTDKSFAVEELAFRIKGIKQEFREKIIISCRELDWYGETDIKDLENEIGDEFKVYRICPLDDDKRRELADLILESDSNEFLDQYSDTGFLNNPQLLYLIAQLFKYNSSKKPTSVLEVYSRFIGFARESSPERKWNATEEPDSDEFRKLIGYLSFYYFFSNIDTFQDDVLDKIVSNENGYSKDYLQIASGSKIFEKHAFIHRSIAEYSCGWFLSELINEGNHSKKRIEGLFGSNKKIPTELRSVFSWLCSISGDEYFFSLDPFHQALLGDSSFFSLRQKMDLILEVRRQAEENPYFITTYFKRHINGLYEKNLDGFLIKEYEKSMKLDNHYILFLGLVITSGGKNSETLREYVKKVVLEYQLGGYYKIRILEIVLNDNAFLLSLLNQIIEGKISDTDDTIKEYILTRRYPDLIAPPDIIRYIKAYNKPETIGHFYFLFNTPFPDMFELVIILLTNYHEDSRDKHLQLPSGIDSFLSEYVVALALSYKTRNNTEYIYGRLKEVLNFFGPLEGPRFTSFKYQANDIIESRKEEIVELANELFSLFIDDQLQINDSYLHYHDFTYFFGLENPTNRLEIFKSKLSQSNNINQNKMLLAAIHSEMKTKDGTDIDTLLELAIPYDLAEEVNRWLNPPIPEYQIEWNKRDKKWRQEENERIRKNEEYFNGKSNSDLASDFNVLHNITNMVFIADSTEYKRHISEETFTRLREVLRSILIGKLISPEYLTIKSLAKDSPDVRRNIDHVYYTACQLNTESQYELIEDENFLQYLYFISFRMGLSSNVIKGRYLDWYEKNEEKVLGVFRKYLVSVIEHHLPRIKSTTRFCEIINGEAQLERFKNISRFFVSDNIDITNAILKNLMHEYAFNLDLFELSEIAERSEFNEENQLTTSAIIAVREDKKDDFTQKMAVAISEFLNTDIRSRSLEKVPEELKELRVRLVDFMLSVFNSNESIRFNDGLQSNRDECASYLRETVLLELSVEELNQLLLSHKGDGDIWKNRILNRVSENEQNESDSNRVEYSIEKAKNFLLSQTPLNNEDYFTDLVNKIESLVETIQANRNNDKQNFWDSENTSRSEESCRDIILQRMEDRYGHDLYIVKERYEGNNRVDLSIQSRGNPEYEVQVECKKDNNRGIIESVTEQLIAKYMENKVDYGVYLVFCFMEKTDVNELIDTLVDKIPSEHAGCVKVICLDLRM